MLLIILTKKLVIPHKKIDDYRQIVSQTYMLMRVEKSVFCWVLL